MEWFKIPDYPDYEITHKGLVRHKIFKKIKSIYLNDSGYKSISLNLNHKSKPERLHRLIAFTFIPNPLNLPCINHKDGDKLNNDIPNLEWCDKKYNNQHGFRTGLINNTGVNNGMAKLNENQVIEIKKLLALGKLSQYKIANKFGVSRSCVMNIKNRGQWSHIKI